MDDDDDFDDEYFEEEAEPSVSALVMSLWLLACAHTLPFERNYVAVPTH